MKSIAVIDYGMGNLHSVAKALEHVCPDTRVYVTNDAAKIEASDRVLLPGVGAIRDCMAEIKRLGVDHIVCLLLKINRVSGPSMSTNALAQTHCFLQGLYKGLLWLLRKGTFWDAASQRLL